MATLIEQIVPGTTNAIDAATRINEALRESGGGLTLDGSLTAVNGNFNGGLTISGNNTSNIANNTLRIVDTDTYVEAGHTLGRFEFYSTDGAKVSSYINAIYTTAQGGSKLTFGQEGVDHFEITSIGTKTTGNHEVTGDYLIDSRVMVSNYSWGGANNNTWIGTTNTTVTGVAVNEGNYNTAIGVSALRYNTTGHYNTANGVNALLYNTTGYYNTASGVSALAANTTGYYNTASGLYAGRFIASGLANETSNKSLYIGANTKAKLANGSNEIVVGYNTIGNGSNTATWGNVDITNHYFSGSGSFGGAISPGISVFDIGKIYTSVTSGMVITGGNGSSYDYVFQNSADLTVLNIPTGTQNVNIKGKTTTNTFNITNVPTSATGLSSGDIWSNAGVLTIVA